MIRHISLLLLLLILNPVFAGQDTLPVDSLILDLTFNLHFNKALHLVREQQALHPDSPKYFFYEAAIQFSKRPYIAHTGPYKGRRARHDSLMRVIIDVATPAINKFADRKFSNAEKMYMAGLYGYRGRAYGEESSWLATFKDALKGRRLLNDLIKNDSTDYNPRLGVGIFYYYTDRLSGLIGFVAGILGFSGDREYGLKNLIESFQKGTYVRPESAITLLDAYVTYENNERAGMPYFRWMIDHYPDNWIIREWYINEMLDIGRGDWARDALHKSFAGINPLTRSRYYYEKCAYDSARQFLRSVYKQSDTYWPGQLQWAWYIDSVMSIVDKAPMVSKEKKKTFQPYMKDDLRRFKKAGSKLIPFFKTIAFIKMNPRRDSLGEASHFSKFPTDDPFYHGLYNYTLGQYYLNNKIWDLAEHNLHRAQKEFPAAFLGACTKSLIWLYQFKRTDKEHIQHIEQVINRGGFEKLKYQVRDLKALYKMN